MKPRRRVGRVAVASALLLGVLPFRAAADPQVGAVLASVAVESCGELAVVDDEIVYKPWVPDGRPVLLHYAAARMGVAQLNRPALREILRIRPAIRPHLVTVLNARDATWGTGLLIKGQVERRKRKQPSARLVLDCDDRLGPAWDLPRGSSVLMLLDAGRRVRFVHVGEATPEVRRALAEAVDEIAPEEPTQAP